MPRRYLNQIHRRSSDPAGNHIKTVHIETFNDFLMAVFAPPNPNIQYTMKCSNRKMYGRFTTLK